jgi:hypothetical protein
VHPRPEERDFYDPDVPTDADPSRLRRVILAQAEEPGGAAVLLFTTATLADGADGAGDPVGGADGVVGRTAAEMELDGPPELFSPDAYLLQSALGEQLLPGEA